MAHFESELLAAAAAQPNLRRLFETSAKGFNIASARPPNGSPMASVWHRCGIGRQQRGGVMASLWTPRHQMVSTWHRCDISRHRDGLVWHRDSFYVAWIRHRNCIDVTSEWHFPRHRTASTWHRCHSVVESLRHRHGIERQQWGTHSTPIRHHGPCLRPILKMAH